MCQESVNYGDIINTGVRVKLHVNVNTQMKDARMTYISIPDKKEPAKQSLEFSVGALQRPLNIASVK